MKCSVSHRRALLLGAGAAGLSFSLPALGETPAPARGNVLVAIFLRGGVDGLSLCVPYTEAAYYAERKSIAIPRPGKRGGAIDLDGRFGLHPRLAPLVAAWRANELAVVHAVGSPDPTRSHFQAQDDWETATPGRRSTRDGWLGRALEQEAKPGVLPAVAVSERVPLALRGRANVLAAKPLSAARLRAPAPVRPALERGFSRLWSRGDDPMRRAGRGALDAVSRLRGLDEREPDNGAEYAPVARPLRDLAGLIKADLGLRVGWVDVGGWDTHQGQGDGEGGRLSRQLTELGRALAAFRQDLGDDMQRVVVLVMSEFGRTVRENGTSGTDHGHGSAMLILGGNVRGGRVLGSFPGLEEPQRFEARDLAVTTDFRAVLGEVAVRHLGVKDVEPVLPGYGRGLASLGIFAPA